MQRGKGKSTYDAILDSGSSRLRPVSMAAATTILGMIPLFTDAFYIAMAVTIVGGLAVATVLTMWWSCRCSTRSCSRQRRTRRLLRKR
ncbi:MAG: efflux RND transporter permease subunit [Deltaproteobacteria bacterium]|nr:efflux RND transporter permease subunit [Deltaproteobacteria bacterium]